MGSELKARSLLMLSKTFDRPLDDDVVAFMLEAVDDMTDDEINNACKRAMRDCKFMPSIAELREFVMDERRAHPKPLPMRPMIDTRDREFELCSRTDRDDLAMTDEQYADYVKQEEAETGEKYWPPGFRPGDWNEDGTRKNP